jgi:hypothetical protein
VVVALTLGAGLLGPGMVAAADVYCPAGKPNNCTCGSSQQLVRSESKACKATSRRAAFNRFRACCQNAKGKVKCKPFKKCPKVSPA